MAAAAKKHVKVAPQATPSEKPAPGMVIGDNEQVRAASAGPSPAKAMQDRLLRHYSPAKREMSSLFLTLLITVACVGTWFAGTGMYTSV